jgi:hypothetical protein
MLGAEADPGDAKYFRRWCARARHRPAPRAPQVLPERVKRFHAEADVRRWGPGERIVFEPYTKEEFEESFNWIREHRIFDPAAMGTGRYEQACVSSAP